MDVMLKDTAWKEFQLKSIDGLFELVIKEHNRQVKKWGVQSVNPFRWFTWLVEEVGELAEALEDYNSRDGGAKEVRDEAIQIATLALKIAEMAEMRIK